MIGRRPGSDSPGTGAILRSGPPVAGDGPDRLQPPHRGSGQCQRLFMEPGGALDDLYQREGQDLHDPERGQGENDRMAHRHQGLEEQIDRPVDDVERAGKRAQALQAA